MGHAGLWAVAFAAVAAVASAQPSLTETSTSYRAKIALEGGVALPTTPLVIPVQEGRVLWRCTIAGIFGNGTVVYRLSPMGEVIAPDTSQGFPDDCQVNIRLEGYETADVVLHDKAVIVLRRIGAREGSIVSKKSLQPPMQAKRAYEKGVAAIARKKWARARKELEQAVAIWPEYAQAWTDIGEVCRQESRPEAARAAYEHAIQADPGYVRAYVPAARLALDEGRAEQGLRLTETALAINPHEFPEAYFYNGVANYNLKRFDAAEKSARRAIELDAKHELPRAEHLLGFALASKGEYKAAIEHLRTYVRISPLASDVIETLTLIRSLEVIATGGYSGNPARSAGR